MDEPKLSGAMTVATHPMITDRVARAVKLSLSARFGVSIAYYKPAHQEYHDIVRTLAERQGVNLPEEELLLEADRWATRHGGESGRVAQQFVDMLAGKNNSERA